HRRRARHHRPVLSALSRAERQQCPCEVLRLPDRWPFPRRSRPHHGRLSPLDCLDGPIPEISFPRAEISFRQKEKSLAKFARPRIPVSTCVPHSCALQSAEISSTPWFPLQ